MINQLIFWELSLRHRRNMESMEQQIVKSTSGHYVVMWTRIKSLMLTKFIVTIWQFAVFWASSGSWLIKLRFFVFSTLTSSGAEVCCRTEASPSPSIYLLWLIIIIVFLLACYMFASYPASISDNIDRPGKVFVSVKKKSGPFLSWTISFGAFVFISLRSGFW